MTRVHSIWCALALAGVLAAVAPAAHADVIVLSAKGATLQSGTTLRDDATIDLPAGASVNVLLPSGTMRELKGPAKLKVAELTRGERAADGLLGRVSGILEKKSNEAKVGAVRAATVAAPRSQIAFSWSDVPVDAEGDICVGRQAVSLVRAAATRPARVTVVDMATNTRAEVSFGENVARMPWPAQIEPRAGKYAVLMQDRPLRQVQLRIIDPLPGRDNILRILHGSNCELQMQALLRELTGS